MRILPCVREETVMIRVAQQQRKGKLPPLGSTGLHGSRLEAFEALLGKPQGVILVTAPSGHGRTTTCYRALQSISTVEKNIVTAEHLPVVDLEDIAQIDVAGADEMTFGDAIRSARLQDADVIFCGDAPDRDAAEMCFEAGQSGQLVLLALCAQSVRHALQCLRGMEVGEFMIRDGIIGASCQRLFGKLCVHCRKPREPAPEDADWLRANGVEELPEQLWHAEGCEKCRETGIRGRTGVFGVMDREAVLDLLPESGGEGFGEDAGMRSLRQDAAERVAQGEIGIEQLRRGLG